MNTIVRKFKNLPVWLLMNVKPINRLFPDKLYIKILYRLYTGHKLDLDNPQGFGEKLQWIKLYGYQPIYTTLVDKYKVKKYVSEIIGDDYVIPLLGVYDSFDEIDFDKLPNCFVIKCNHDSGSFLIVDDKQKLDKEKARDFFNKRMKRNYFYLGRDIQYKYIVPKIIIEQYMRDDSQINNTLDDYKFFCFNGKPKIMFFASGRGNNRRFDFFDMNYNHLPIKYHYPNSSMLPLKPKCFEEMKTIATKLCGDFPFMRIDLYEINGKVYFGEYTLIHDGGLYPFEPAEWEQRLGDWIDLSKEKNLQNEDCSD